MADHPCTFATLTAPSFGVVHGVRHKDPCRSRRDKPTCPHGRPLWCSQRHQNGDPRLGEPLCGDCYDYTAHVVCPWHAPELWRRFTITLQRDLARRTGLSVVMFRQLCRISYSKVVEFQARGIDQTSTYDPFAAGPRLRVLPALGHFPVAMITAGSVDRAIDDWEQFYGRSTVKNTVSALVLVLDEAVRDGLVPRNPAKDRARRRTVGRSPASDREANNPRDLALPDIATLDRLVDGVVAAGRHQSYGDMVTILATTALRISEVSGLQVGDVDLERGLLSVSRQTYPGRGGLVTKQTKGRRRRSVPIIDPLQQTLERLTAGRSEDAWLVTGPRGGVITTATLRDATG